MHYKIFLILIFFISSGLKSEIFVDPGEMVAVKISSCPDIKNKEIFFYTLNNIEYAIIPSPFSKNSRVINGYCVPIKINKKDFGESRITILDVSKVNLSEEDSQRAYKESQLIRESLNSYSTNIQPSLKFISPVDGIISSRYGKQRYINDQPRSPHLALDIAAAEGTEIIAPAPGKVILVGDFFYSGNYLVLDHGFGLLSSYSHMSKINVQAGDYIKQRDIIGEVGSTGRVTGPHLHWSVYLEKQRINPESLIAENFFEKLFN
jgi:murein DD-endopeptidase MepM/ murein hydrolase activator NlpD